jgi:hypothetical protein
MKPQGNEHFVVLDPNRFNNGTGDLHTHHQSYHVRFFRHVPRILATSGAFGRVLEQRHDPGEHSAGVRRHLCRFSVPSGGPQADCSRRIVEAIVFVIAIVFGDN